MGTNSRGCSEQSSRTGARGGDHSRQDLATVFSHHVLSRSPGLALPSPALQAERLRPREGRPPATQTHSAKHPNHACTPPCAQHCVLASTAQGQRGSRGVNHGRTRARKGHPRRAVRTDAQEAGRAERASSEPPGTSAWQHRAEERRWMLQQALYGNVFSKKSRPTLCDPMDCNLSGSSDRGILQARMLEWVAISFSRGSSQPRDQAQVSCTAGRRFTI